MSRVVHPRLLSFICPPHKPTGNRDGRSRDCGNIKHNMQRTMHYAFSEHRTHKSTRIQGHKVDYKHKIGTCRDVCAYCSMLPERITKTLKRLEMVEKKKRKNKMEKKDYIAGRRQGTRKWPCHPKATHRGSPLPDDSRRSPQANSGRSHARHQHQPV